MPLTVQVDGKYINGSSTPNNQIRAKWFNDYRDLLTGAMTDQPVVLNYQPAAAGGSPTLQLRTNNNCDLLQGLNGSSALVFKVDRFGVVSLGGTVNFNPTPLNGEAANSVQVVASAGAVNQADIRINNLSGGNIYIVGKSAYITIDQNANVTAAGKFTSNGNVFAGGSGGHLYITPQQTGATALGIALQSYDGSAVHTPFSVGYQINSATAWVDNGGSAVFTNSVQWGAGVNGVRSFVAYDNTNRINTYWAPQSGANAQGHLFVVWSGSAQVNLFSIGGTFLGTSGVDPSGNFFGPAGGGIPTTRNGSAISVPIFTGTNTPVNPPPGSIWIKA